MTRRLSPTDISQFIRLEQCERYLWFRLEERAKGRGFMTAYDVKPQSIPPLLTRSGRLFEEKIEAAIRSRYPALNLSQEAGKTGSRLDDNERVVELARSLPAGETLVLFQPRLHVELDGWLLTGDLDLLRLERGEDGALHVLIVDIKSSTSVKVEHRLQVAFYHAMLARLFEQAGVTVAHIGTGILYKGPAEEHEDGSPSEAPSAAASSAENFNVLVDSGSLSGARSAGGPRVPSGHGYFDARLPAPVEDQPHANFGTRLPGSDADASVEDSDAQAACTLFGTEALLEIIGDSHAYLDAVTDLVTGPASAAGRVARTPFEDLSYHLTYKCDGCLYNEYCMKSSAEKDDLSLIPHLTAGEKAALRRLGIRTVRDLALLKQFSRSPGGQAGTDLVPALGKEELCRRVATTWPVGPRLDELVHRARRYRRWKGDPVEALSYIPSKGYGTLPYADAGHAPNLIRIYIDAQHDYLHDRIYMLGALVAACEGGVPKRWRSIVHLTDGPPDCPEKERQLFRQWTDDLLKAVVQLAFPDSEGELRAPIHVIFFNCFEQRLLLEGLSRHLSSILGAAPALYDFMTQLAAFDSPIATFLDQEIRELKNYPIVCQSLQAIAEQKHLGFDWNEGERFQDIYYTRMFDYLDRLERDGEAEWYTGRARFNSQIPLEYVYGAWGELEASAAGDDLAPYRAVTPELLKRFQARRLEALERITADFKGNPLTEKRPFDLPDLAAYTDRARSLAHAMQEFVTIERHVELNGWKFARHAPPERRVLMGETLLVHYLEEDQDPETVARCRENERRRLLREQFEAAFRAENPSAARISLPKEQVAECRWSQDGLRIRLRLESTALDCTLDEALALFTLKAGDPIVLNTRWTVDSRLAPEEQTSFTPTPKQMLYGTRAALLGFQLERDEADRVTAGTVEVELRTSRGGPSTRGYVFNAFERPPLPGTLYTIDSCPDSWYDYWSSRVAEGLCAIEEGREKGSSTLYSRLVAPREHLQTLLAAWTPTAAEAQARFMAGLDALREAGALHAFEASKREYIGGRGNAPILLVQGPPGTGKSYSTAFALFARMQGAMAAGADFRAFVSCKTHAATDVLLEKILEVREVLGQLKGIHPEIWGQYFDDRLLEAPLFRVGPRKDPPDGVTALPTSHPSGTPASAKIVEQHPWCIVAATPGGVYRLIKDRWSDRLFGHFFCNCLVLDEASQMNLPEACMAALPLHPDGQLIVVGDHRQMPPIVQHDWESEPRRTFQEYRAYESLFLTLLPLDPPMIKFEESFRLHADMAEFLRREVYEQDGIRYHSKQLQVLPSLPHPDQFLEAVLAPEHPVVVVVHDEAESQTRNAFEEALVTPILEALADPARYGLDPEEGLGVVVPHRAQRAALQLDIPCLSILDPETGAVVRSAVDTVERFQGGERTVILVSATESSREYLLQSSKFLLDPRRLTVAASRAKQKLVLVASRSVFSLFSPDEETFHNSQLWKNLLRRTCTHLLWTGDLHGILVEVWGNQKD
jgi:AAA domain-containing protein/PD-(D/E)XK nuclease superfamily protein